MAGHLSRALQQHAFAENCTFPGFLQGYSRQLKTQIPCTQLALPRSSVALYWALVLSGCLLRNCWKQVQHTGSHYSVSLAKANNIVACSKTKKLLHTWHEPFLGCASMTSNILVE
eukprot:scaffold217480_cov19-Tisochrysis_lutea.AAC.1